MAKEFAKKFYKSSKWLKCRTSYIKKRIEIDGGRCEKCKVNPGYIVHHKITLTPDNINNPDISLNHELLEYDCKNCHDKYDGHGFNNIVEPLVYFDDRGHPIPKSEDIRR